MTKNVFKAIGLAASKLFRHWQLLAIFAGLYSCLLAACYFFVATREANAWQVLLTFALAIVAPVIFFVIQTLCVSYTRNEAGTTTLVMQSFKNFWKLTVVSLPLVVIAGLLVFLLGQLEDYLMVKEAARMTVVLPPFSTPNASHSVGPVTLILATARFLIFGFALPLATIHLWITTTREGVNATLKKVPHTLLHALAPHAVLIYAIGVVLFGVIPRFLLFSHSHAQRPSLEIGLLVFRLVLAFAFILFGWVITVGALAETSTEKIGETASEHLDDAELA